jgi:hypothetical protein
MNTYVGLLYEPSTAAVSSANSLAVPKRSVHSGRAFVVGMYVVRCLWSLSVSAASSGCDAQRLVDLLRQPNGYSSKLSGSSSTGMAKSICLNSL